MFIFKKSDMIHRLVQLGIMFCVELMWKQIYHIMTGIILKYVKCSRVKDFPRFIQLCVVQLYDLCVLTSILQSFRNCEVVDWIWAIQYILKLTLVQVWYYLILRTFSLLHMLGSGWNFETMSCSKRTTEHISVIKILM